MRSHIVTSCDMAATVERAECEDAAPQTEVEALPLEEVETPGTKTIEDVAAFLEAWIKRRR